MHLKNNFQICEERVTNVMKNYSMLSLTHGHKVLEIQPAIAWDKLSISFLIHLLLNGMKHGCSILVSTAPKTTNVAYSIRDPSEVKQFLHQLVQWKKMGMDRDHLTSFRSGYITIPTHKHKRTPVTASICHTGV
jgi:hypothetical protein